MDLYFLPQPSRAAPSPPSSASPFRQQDETSSNPARYSLSIIPSPRKRTHRIRPIVPSASGLWTVPEEVGVEGSSYEQEHFEEIDLKESTSAWQMRAARSSFFEDDNDDEEGSEGSEEEEEGEATNEGNNDEDSSSLDDFQSEFSLDDLLSTLLNEVGYSAFHPKPSSSLLDDFNFLVPSSPPLPLSSSPPRHSLHPFATSSPLLKTTPKKPTPLNFDPSSFPLPPTSPPPLSSASSSSHWTSPSSSSSYASPRTPSTPWRDQSDLESLRTPPSPSRDLFAERDFDEDEPTRLRSNASKRSSSSSGSFHLSSFGIQTSPSPTSSLPSYHSFNNSHPSTPPSHPSFSNNPHPFASQSSPSSSNRGPSSPSLNRPAPNPPTDFLPFRAAPSPPTSPTRTPSVRSNTSSRSSSSSSSFSSRSSTSSRSSGSGRGKFLPKRGALPGLFLDLGRENVGRAL